MQREQSLARLKRRGSERRLTEFTCRSCWENLIQMALEAWPSTVVGEGQLAGKVLCQSRFGNRKAVTRRRPH